MNDLELAKTIDCNIIKKIGVGAFSTVYLSKINDEYYVSKEIRLQELLKKKLKRGKKLWKQKNVFETATPHTYVPMKDEILYIDYYYDKLEEIIQSEIEILKIIQHPNIIEIFNSKKIDDTYLIKMEYCHYGDAHQVLKSNTLFTRNIYGGFYGPIFFQFVQECLNGLECLHTLNLIHRDIKPHNILIHLDHSGSIVFKLSDLGFVCLDSSTNLPPIDYLDDDINNILVNKYFKICGTPYYMAPELICSYNENHHSTHFYNKTIDIWSLGVTIFEIFFNKLPVVAKELGDLYKFYTENDFNKNFRLNLVKYKIPNSLITLFIHTITTNASNRYNISQLKTINFNDFDSHSDFNEIIHTYKETVTDSWTKLDSSSILEHLNLSSQFLNWFSK